MMVAKEELEGRLDGFILKKMTDCYYEIDQIKSSQLLTWNRFDLGFKLFYLDYYLTCPAIARKVYNEDIRSQTMGSYSELGNVEKSGFKKYLNEFITIYESIKLKGFDRAQTVIPLASSETIINGAHRVASAIHLNQDITCIFTKIATMTCDHSYFFKRGVPTAILDMVAVKFIEYAENVYLAFLWPSGKGKIEQTEKLFKNIIYKKNISFSPRGAFNLLVELYKHMDWVGSLDTGYSGAKQKLVECFPDFDDVVIIAFQAESIDEVKKIKEEVRCINNIGFSSIHITDNKEEAVCISSIVFNENGVHFLNHAEPYRYQIFSQLKKFESKLAHARISAENIVIDGSTVLSLYGIRKNYDIDFITDKKINLEGFFENHESEIKYYLKDKLSLIYDPRYHFCYSGFKFVSFMQLYEMKKRRNEQKDRNDISLMKSFVAGNKIHHFFGRTRQMLFYLKLKIERKARALFHQSLKVTGLHAPLRHVYRKIRKKTS